MTLRALTRMKTGSDARARDVATLSSLVEEVVERQEEVGREVEAVEAAVEEMQGDIKELEVKKCFQDDFCTEFSYCCQESKSTLVQSPPQ